MSEQFTQGPSILQSDIVNNLTTDSSTKPLSAAQGKALDDKITTINGKLYTVLTSGGLKTWAIGTSEGFTCFRYNNSVTDTPCDYGHGYVVHYGQNIRIVVFNMTDIPEYSAYSNNSGSSWSSWEQVALNSEIATSYYVITGIGLIRFVGNIAIINFTDSPGQIPSDGLQLPYTFVDDLFILCQYYNGSSNTFGELQIKKNGKVYVRASGTYVNATYVLAQAVAYLG